MFAVFIVSCQIAGLCFVSTASWPWVIGRPTSGLHGQSLQPICITTISNSPSSALNSAPYYTTGPDAYGSKAPYVPTDTRPYASSSLDDHILAAPAPGPAGAPPSSSHSAAQLQAYKQITMIYLEYFSQNHRQANRSQPLIGCSWKGLKA